MVREAKRLDEKGYAIVYHYRRRGGSGYVPTVFDGFVKFQEVHDHAKL